MAYVLSPSVGLPEIGDDVGNWLEPLGVVAILAELVCAALAGAVLAWAAVPPVRPTGDTAERAIDQWRGGGGGAEMTAMETDGTRVDEIADGIFRISTLVADIGPTGLTFNQFLVRAEEPLLFHTGHRSMFPAVKEAIASLLPLERLRWITFGHVESDECGSMNLLLEAAPRAEVAHGALGCLVSLNEMADRPPRALADAEVLDLGGRRVRHLDTPHVPHAWEARLLFEETTATLLCGDLFTHLGDGPAVTTEDIVGPAGQAEDVFRPTCLTPATGPTIRRLAELQPISLALMHGSSFAGDCAAALGALADSYDARLEEATAP